MSSPRVVVVGAGPAGLAAAAQASLAGCAVTLVDENEHLGGQYFRSRQNSADEGSPRWFERHAKAVERMSGAIPIDAVGGGRLDVWSPDGGMRSIAYDGIVLATGAYDRPVALPGWTLPRVVTAGGALTMAEVWGVLPGRRVVVGGSGPFLLATAAALARHGARVTVVEAQPFARLAAGLPTLARDPEIARQAAGYLATLIRHRARFRYGQVVSAIDGGDRVERVGITRVDRQWFPRPGATAVVEADAVAIGFGFVAQLDLAVALGCDVVFRPAEGSFVIAVDEMGATSVPGVFAAGENTGLGGARLAAIGGRIAALALAKKLGATATSPNDDASLLTALLERRCRLRPVADWIVREFSPRPGLWSLAVPETIVCRCEDVRLGEGAAVPPPATPIALKTATRASMGLCQGRICLPYWTAWLAEYRGFRPAAAEVWSSRPPLRPVSLGAWPVRSTGPESAADEAP